MKLKDFVFIALGIAVLLFALFYNGNSKTITKTVTITKTDTLTIPIKVDTIIYKNKWIYKTDTFNITTIIHDTVLLEKIVKEYFADFVYNDTIVNDSNLTFSLSDTISHNRIKSRIYSYNINYKNELLKQKKTALYLGGGISSDMTLNIGANVLNKKLMYGLKYNLTNKTVEFDLKYRIFSK